VVALSHPEREISEGPQPSAAGLAAGGAAWAAAELSATDRQAK
jgi:hypothetical protein